MFNPLNQHNTKKNKKYFNFFKKNIPIAISITIHILLFFAIQKTKFINIAGNKQKQDNPISVRFNKNKNPQSFKNNPKKIKNNNNYTHLDHTKKNHKKIKPVFKNTKKPNNNEITQKGIVTKPNAVSPNEKNTWDPIISKDLKHFLPKMESYNPKSTGDFGDNRSGKKLPWGRESETLESENPIGPLVVKRPKMVHTSYDYAGYFMGIDRLFSNAWGGTRFLPQNSRFRGIAGEVIEYKVFINRDGSLKKITNITAKKERHRDFSDVDLLVSNVFKNVFPIQPVPKRIPDDPLVMIKRIVFEGYYQFEMF